MINVILAKVKKIKEIMWLTPFPVDDCRRGGRQEQRHAYSTVEEAPAVRREPRLRPRARTGGGGGDGGNVRLFAPEPLRCSVHSAKLLVSATNIAEFQLLHHT